MRRGAGALDSAAMDFWGPIRRRVTRRMSESLLPTRVIITRVAGAGPRVALTFDDGPDPLSGALLDALDRLDVRATFFLVGRGCEKWPQTVQEIVRRGHEVGGHGHTHTRFPQLAPGALREELIRTSLLLPSAPRWPALVRPPHGSTTVASMARTAAAGYTTVLWSLDSQDSTERDPVKVAACADRARPGDVMLLHEGQKWTIDALGPLVGRLRERGLLPCTVGELLDA